MGTLPPAGGPLRAVCCGGREERGPFGEEWWGGWAFGGASDVLEYSGGAARAGVRWVTGLCNAIVRKGAIPGD